MLTYSKIEPKIALPQRDLFIFQNSTLNLIPEVYFGQKIMRMKLNMSAEITENVGVQKNFEKKKRNNFRLFLDDFLTNFFKLLLFFDRIYHNGRKITHIKEEFFVLAIT